MRVGTGFRDIMRKLTIYWDCNLKLTDTAPPEYMIFLDSLQYSKRTRALWSTGQRGCSCSKGSKQLWPNELLHIYNLRTIPMIIAYCIAPIIIHIASSWSRTSVATKNEQHTGRASVLIVTNVVDHQSWGQTHINCWWLTEWIATGSIH